MENDFYPDEFEAFLKENTEQFRMFPSDGVWKKIHRQIHIYRRWTMIGLSALLVGATFLGGKLLLQNTNKPNNLSANGTQNNAEQFSQPSAGQFANAPSTTPSASLGFGKTTTEGFQKNFLVPNKLIIVVNNLKSLHLSNMLFQDIAERSVPTLKVAWIKPAEVDSPARLNNGLHNDFLLANNSNPNSTNQSLNKLASPQWIDPLQTLHFSPQLGGPLLAENWVLKSSHQDKSDFRLEDKDEKEGGQKSNSSAAGHGLLAQGGSGNGAEGVGNSGKTLPKINGEESKSNNANLPVAATTVYAVSTQQNPLPKETSQEVRGDDVFDYYAKQEFPLLMHRRKYLPTKLPVYTSNEARKEAEDYAALYIPPKRKTLMYQFYVTPTISYRRLTDWNRRVNLNNFPGGYYTGGHQSLNQVVQHKPTFGFEAGTNLLLKTRSGLIFKTGLQFNISGFELNGFWNNSEQATFVLTNKIQMQGNPTATDTLKLLSNMRNFSGITENSQHNTYVQLSIPVGAEIRLAGNHRFAWNMAGSVQPSYRLGGRSQILSTDYKNYTESPTEFIRKWNVHSSFETYFSFERNGLRWQVGPQIRYQLLSSYKNIYPIRENLIDYGLKIGVSKIF